MRVAILIQQPVSLFELGYAVELFALPQTRYSGWYETDVVTFAEGPQAGIAGVSVAASKVADLDGYDMLIVPAWPFNFATITASLANAVHELAQRGGRMISFCTGAFLLAELGLLNNKKATTHWAYATTFRYRFPEVNYIDDVLYVYDGHIGCSAGSAAGIDLSMQVIRGDYGYQIANQIARRLVMSAHRSGGQSQFVEKPILKSPNHFAAALDWAVARLNEKISINALADRAAMSRRSFDRKFRSAFNMSPQQWLVQQRLEKAKVLLEESADTIEQIAAQCGFESAMTMRHHFKKVLTLPPRQFREQFGRLQNQQN